MTSKAQRPPAGQPWVWETRELRVSDAWRSQSINAYRLVNFLLIEHMNKGGKENGNLKAPYEQLEAFGIGARHIADAIAEVEAIGLINCRRGGRRVATTYTLTWLPHRDGTPANNRWRTYVNPELKPLPAPKSKNLPSEGKVVVPSEGKVDTAKLPSEGKVDRPRPLPSEGKVPSISSYQGGQDISYLSAGDGTASAAAPLASPAPAEVEP